MLIGSATSRRALLRQLWAMVQTRAEAASLVVSLQKTAVIQGVALYAVAALAASACVTALILFVAVATPPEYRALALGLVVLTLLGTAIFAAMRASRQIRRDTALIADFWKGLRLDLAMINLALKDPDPDDDEETRQTRTCQGRRARSRCREGRHAKYGGGWSGHADRAEHGGRKRCDDCGVYDHRPATRERTRRHAGT